jgi:non-homologous end joining protein Ku
MVKLAQHIIRTKSGEFDPSLLEDHYRNALDAIYFPSGPALSVLF